MKLLGATVTNPKIKGTLIQRKYPERGKFIAHFERFSLM